MTEPDSLPPPGPEPGGGEESAAERVKQELARELHDQVAQNIVTVLMQLESFKRDQVGRRGVLQEVASVQVSLREVLNNLRQLLWDLRGQQLEENFVRTIRRSLLRNFQRRTGVRVTMSVGRSWPSSLPPETYIHVYRIIQEATNNACRHAGCSAVLVALRNTPDRFVVTIHDNGRGIEQTDAGEPVGMGLLGMRERAALLGGDLSITSAAGSGTTVTARIPKEALSWSPKRSLRVS